MLKPEEMNKVRIIGLEIDKGNIIGTLHELGVLQIIDLGKNIEKFHDLIEADKPLASFEVISQHLVKLRAIESLLTKHEFVPVKIQNGKLLDEAEKVVGSTNIIELNKKFVEIKEKREELQEHILILERLKSLSLDFGLLESDFVGKVLGRMSKKRLQELESGLRQLSRYQLMSVELNKSELIVLLIFDKAMNSEFQKVLNSAGVVSLDLPPFSTTPEKFLKSLEEWDVKIESEANAIKEEITAASKTIYSKVLYLTESLELEAQKAEIAAKFGKTNSVCVIEGWVRKKEFDKLNEALMKETDNACAIEVIRTHELAPTYLANPKLLKPFESFITFISIPKSYEFDPTTFFALVFPIMYGIMLGDLGYGTLVFLIGILGYYKAKGMLKDIAFVLIPSGLFSMMFGVFFGEIFGFEPKELGIPITPMLQRISQITQLLTLTIAIGAVHVALGFILGAIKEYEEGKYRHAIAKLGWLFLEIGGIMLFLAVAQGMGFLLSIGAGLIVLALVALVYGEGAIALIEIPKLIGNVFSYSRLMAVGLASVALAFVLNTFKPEPSMGLLIIPAIVIFLGGHLLNLVLGIFEPFVQGARLHYVEFFGKFYEGGGYMFMPFKGNKKYTKDEVV